MTHITTGKSRICCRIHSKRISGSVNMSGLSHVFAELESPSILGGNVARAQTGRFSYWAAEPKEVFTLFEEQDHPFERLKTALNTYVLNPNDKTYFPENLFLGGWIGYFSYELSRVIETLPKTTRDDLSMPLIRLGFYDKLIAYDPLEQDFFLIALELENDDTSPERKLDWLEQLLKKSQSVCIARTATMDLKSIDLSKIRCNMNKDEYTETIRRIKRYIYDGEVYQINFSRRFESAFNASPIDLYHWQNDHNPSGYAAYIRTEDHEIISASPEMFITVSDGILRTKPIKGTRPRLGNKQLNAQYYDELLHSEKEQAELNMIVDLERNDVAKISRPGTRRVVQPRTIETYPTVFHAVATIEGQLRENILFCDVLKAMFPGGSITGAPKIRAMEIIDETEPTARGVYTGSIGFIGIEGNISLNIAIRTIIIKDGKAYVQTGGGIVADSDPEAEWQETITKANALLAGLISVARRE